MSYIEKKIDSEEKYRGVIVNVRLDHAELCDGSIVKREVVEHPVSYTHLDVYKRQLKSFKKEFYCDVISYEQIPEYVEKADYAVISTPPTKRLEDVYKRQV